jgi:hypothetical protein
MMVLTYENYVSTRNGSDGHTGISKENKCVAGFV